MKRPDIKRVADLFGGVVLILFGVVEVIYYRRNGSGLLDALPFWIAIIIPLAMLFPSIVVRIFSRNRHGH